MNTEVVSENSLVSEETKLPQIDKLGRSYATGKRKNAIARVWIKQGTGKIIINNIEYSLYFKRPILQTIVSVPLVVTNSVKSFDVMATVIGGGLSGQAGAIRHGISKALDNYNPNNHKALKEKGFLTRDSRVVESKKYGRRKARRSFQFSKR